MSWIRCLVVGERSQAAAMEAALAEGYVYKKFAETPEAVLYAYEGRSVPVFDGDATLNMGIDARHIAFFSGGNSDLAGSFNAVMELTCGLALALSSKSDLSSEAEALVQSLLELGGLEEESPDEDRWTIRFDVAEASADEVLGALYELTQCLNDQGLPYRIATFEDGSGVVLGDLDDAGPFVGPSACASASWEQAGTTVQLTLTQDETLLDGCLVEGFAPQG